MKQHVTMYVTKGQSSLGLVIFNSSHGVLFPWDWSSPTLLGHGGSFALSSVAAGAACQEGAGAGRAACLSQQEWISRNSPGTALLLRTLNERVCLIPRAGPRRCDGSRNAILVDCKLCLLQFGACACNDDESTRLYTQVHIGRCDPLPLPKLQQEGIQRYETPSSAILLLSKQSVSSQCQPSWAPSTRVLHYGHMACTPRPW